MQKKILKKFSSPIFWPPPAPINPLLRAPKDNLVHEYSINMLMISCATSLPISGHLSKKILYYSLNCLALGNLGAFFALKSDPRAHIWIFPGVTIPEVKAGLLPPHFWKFSDKYNEGNLSYEPKSAIFGHFAPFLALRGTKRIFLINQRMSHGNQPECVSRCKISENFNE